MGERRPGPYDLPPEATSSWPRVETKLNHAHPPPFEIHIGPTQPYQPADGKATTEEEGPDGLGAVTFHEGEELAGLVR